MASVGEDFARDSKKGLAMPFSDLFHGLFGGDHRTRQKYWGSMFSGAGSGLGLAANVMDLTSDADPVIDEKEDSDKTKAEKSAKIAENRKFRAKTNAVAAAGNIAAMGGDFSKFLGNKRDYESGNDGSAWVAGGAENLLNLVGHGLSAGGEIAMAAQSADLIKKDNGENKHTDGGVGDTKRGLEIAGGAVGLGGNALGLYKTWRQYKNAKHRARGDEARIQKAKSARNRALWGSAFSILGNVGKIVANATNKGSVGQQIGKYMSLVGQSGGVLGGFANMHAVANSARAKKQLPVAPQQIEEDDDNDILNIRRNNDSLAPTRAAGKPKTMDQNALAAMTKEQLVQYVLQMQGDPNAGSPSASSANSVNNDSSSSTSSVSSIVDSGGGGSPSVVLDKPPASDGGGGSPSVVLDKPPASDGGGGSPSTVPPVNKDTDLDKSLLGSEGSSDTSSENDDSSIETGSELEEEGEDK